MKYKKILLISLMIAGLLTACGQNEETISLAEPQVANEKSAPSGNMGVASPVEDTNVEPQQGPGKGENRSQTFDYEALAAELNISAEALQAAVEAYQSQGFLNFNEIAEALGIDEAVLSEAFKNVDGSLGRGRVGGFALIDIDYAAIAEVLDVSEESLRAAIENNQAESGPMDVEQIALELGVTVDDLNAAIGIPGGRMNSPRSGSNN